MASAGVKVKVDNHLLIVYNAWTCGSVVYVAVYVWTNKNLIF